MRKQKRPETSTMIAFIKENGLSFSHIATYIGISQGSFSEKVKGARYSKFTEEQSEKIWEFIKELSVKIKGLISK